MMACIRPARPRGDNGSGSILGLATIGSVTAVIALTLPLYIGMAIRQSLEGAADAAALAAADVASGISPGFPCVSAALVATADAGDLASCRIDGLVATVRLQRTFLGVSLQATATAGPPDAVTN
jgi:secretion/DNA translocation related TadE-like protein